MRTSLPFFALLCLAAPARAGAPAGAETRTFMSAAWSPERARKDFAAASAPTADVAGVWKRVALVVEDPKQVSSRLVSDESLEFYARGEGLFVKLPGMADHRCGLEDALRFGFTYRYTMTHSRLVDSVAYECRLESPTSMLCAAYLDYSRWYLGDAEPHEGFQTFFLRYRKEPAR